MSDTEYKLSFNDAIICKYCKRMFSLGRANELIQGLTFPNDDFSLIRAKCPRCYNYWQYKNEEIMKSEDHNNNENKSSEQTEKLQKIINEKNEEIVNLKLRIAKLEGMLEIKQQTDIPNDSFSNQVSDDESS